MLVTNSARMRQKGQTVAELTYGGADAVNQQRGRGRNVKTHFCFGLLHTTGL